MVEVREAWRASLVRTVLALRRAGAGGRKAIVRAQLELDWASYSCKDAETRRAKRRNSIWERAVC